jgi:predicted metal-binding membrane protein
MGGNEMDPNKLALLNTLFPFIAIIVSVTMAAWVLTTWMRIKNGYPLDGAWGQAVYPKKDEEIIERVKLISSENAQLRAELGSVKDRLATVERIVTDDSHRLNQEIEALRLPRN